MYSLYINTNLYLQTIFLFNCLIFCNWEILCLQSPTPIISFTHFSFKKEKKKKMYLLFWILQIHSFAQNTGPSPFLLLSFYQLCLVIPDCKIFNPIFWDFKVNLLPYPLNMLARDWRIHAHHLEGWLLY